MTSRRFAAGTLVLALSAFCAHAATIRVPRDYPTIQGALLAAQENDTVLVASGTYTGAGNREIVFPGFDMVLLSEEGADSTVIECEGTAFGVSFHGGETSAAVLEGFEIRGGGSALVCSDASPSIRRCDFRANDAGGGFGAGIRCLRSAPTVTDCAILANSADLWPGRGGGIYCDESSPTVANCLIEGNSVADEGGGIWCSNSSSPTVAICSIVGNSARYHGGGIYCDGSSSLTLADCSIDGNRTEYGGGGIYCGGSSSLNLNDCSVVQNFCDFEGGGLFATESEVTLEGCLIKWNRATDGGGVYCDGAVATLSGCTISTNRVTSEGGGLLFHESDASSLTACTISENSAFQGAGMYCSLSSPVVVDCTMERNTATLRGGGVYVWYADATLDHCVLRDNLAGSGAGLYSSYGAPMLTECIIRRNSASHSGGGLYFYNSEAPELVNCSIVDNSAGIGGGVVSNGSSPVFTSSILWGDVPQEIFLDTGSAIVTFSDVEGSWPGMGNIDADPLFCDAVCGAFDDLGLATDSPCLGSGQAGVDMGALGETCTEPVGSPGPRVMEIPADYSTIAGALDATCDRDTIIVAPGTYLEGGLAIPDRGIVLMSRRSPDPAPVATVVIDGGGADVIRFLPSRLTRSA